MNSQCPYPWFESDWQRLCRLPKNQLPHAFLFCGATGIGKKALAHAFEKLILCQSPTSDGACGKCRACYLFEQGLHPDLRSQDEDTIGIDEVRELTAFLEETSHQQGKKVVTLFDVEKLQTACANALLKTLEEPPTDSVIILVANKPSILPTIKSRCFLVNLAPSQAQIMSWLKLALKADEKQLQSSLYFASGAPLLAKSLYENKDVIDAMVDALLEGKAKAFDNEQIQQFMLSKPLAALYLFYYFLLDYQRWVLTGKTECLYNDFRMKAVQILKNQLSLPDVNSFVDKVNEAIRTVSLTGINKTLLFDALLCDWQQLCQQGNRV
ncbi:MAG: DNA polymerase III subunit delta' C-terminal domain-containing protein [Candidatus Berkiella sp.]